MGFPRGTSGKEPACQCRRHKRCKFESLGWKDLLEEEMATHSSILVWRIPWTEEPGRLQSIGLPRVGRNWNNFSTHAHDLMFPSLPLKRLCLQVQSCKKYRLRSSVYEIWRDRIQPLTPGVKIRVLFSAAVQVQILDHSRVLTPSEAPGSGTFPSQLDGVSGTSASCPHIFASCSLRLPSTCPSSIFVNSSWVPLGTVFEFNSPTVICWMSAFLHVFFLHHDNTCTAYEWHASYFHVSI